jgi:hypothetical protein
MAESVMERVTWKLNEHDVKLAKLELYRDADRQTVLEYKQDLQKDVEELRAELKPLKNQGLLAQPHPEADKEETERIKRNNTPTDHNRHIVWRRVARVCCISRLVGAG